MVIDRAGKYMLLSGSAVYWDRVSKAKVESQQRSTDIAKCYYKADGSEANPSAKHLARKWKDVVDKVRGVLRLQWEFPAASRNVNAEKCTVKTVDGRQEVTLRIDKDIFKAVFGEAFPAVGKVMAALTNTEATEWVPTPRKRKQSSTLQPAKRRAGFRRPLANLK